MKYSRRITAVVLALMMVISMMPAMVFAEGEDVASEAADVAAASVTAAEGSIDDVRPADEDAMVIDSAADAVAEPEEYEGIETDEAEIAEPEEYAGDEEAYDEADAGLFEESFSEGVDAAELEGADPESLMENFLFSEEPKEENSMTPKRPLSVKGDRLTGNNLKFYNQFKSIINSVYTGKKSNSYVKLSIGSFLGKRTFTASQLGLSKLAYKKNGKWYPTAAAKKKIQALIEPGNWKNVYTSVLSDLSNEGYWVDWYADEDFYRCWYQYYINSSKSITFSTDSWIRFSVPVMPEFAKDAGSGMVYVYKADLSKIAAAENAKTNAQYIVSNVDSEMNTTFADYSSVGKDVNRLWRYCQWITVLTEYDKEAAASSTIDRTSPWSLVSVLDNNENTKAVCVGYARALKYLCDLSTFESDWIDCQILSGQAGEGHMWNLVRMNDGLNYLIDPTWMDNGDSWDDADINWFLRGAPNGTADSYTIEYYDSVNNKYNYYTRSYDAWTKATFLPAERILSKDSSYLWNEVDREISLPKPVIKTPARGKKSITVKWKKASTPLGALYVDGYQIRYSTKKSMKGAKTVTVKGYNKTSKVIKKLKANKYYYVQVRTYVKMGKNRYESDWSVKKKIKTK